MKRISMCLVLALPLFLLLASSAPAGEDGDPPSGAAMAGRADILHVCLDKGAPVNPKDNDNQKPEVPKYECPKTRYINCMPPVQEIYKPMCTKEYLEWAKRHCTGFEVVY